MKSFSFIYGFVCFDGFIEDQRLSNLKQFAYILASLSMRFVPKRFDIRSVQCEIDRFFTQFATIKKINVHLSAISAIWSTPCSSRILHGEYHGDGCKTSPERYQCHTADEDMKKCLTYQSVASTCAGHLESFSEQFLKSCAFHAQFVYH